MAKWMAPVVGGVLLVVIVGVVLLARGRVSVAEAIPTPTMPSPNAYDRYVQAGDAVGDTARLKQLRTQLPTVNDADRTAALAEGAGAMATVRQGFSHTYRQPPGENIMEMYPYYARYRDLAVLFTLEGQAKAVRSDPGGAMQSYLDGLRFGMDVPRGAPLIGSLVGNACETIVRRNGVWPAVPLLSGEQAKAAALRMEALQRTRVTCAETLEEEKWLFQRTLVAMRDHPERFKDDPDMTEFAKLPREELEDLRQAHLRMMDALITEAKKPYPDRKPVSPTGGATAQLLLGTLGKTFSQYHVRATENDTQHALLTTALALQAHKASQGHYPDTLQQLVPTYLSRVPQDPFAKDAPLCYRRAGTPCLLYSIGPDGVDNHGAPVSTAAKSDSTGDIVAGVNTN